MGQLVLGVAVGALGQMVGIPFGIGFMVGSMSWNLLDPPKSQGPRLNENKVRGADYGQMRPILYGTMRLGGIGMGQGSTVNGINKFTEHEEKSGGKGGPEITNYRYTLSFFNEICEGEIIGVWRRWANTRLITTFMQPTTSVWPYTLYLGDTTQTPDPTMETIYGSGEVAPMRGVAYEAVEEVDITDFGNVRPNVEYEAFTAGGDIPWRVSSFDPWPGAGTVAQAATYDNGVITTSETSNSTPVSYYTSRFDIDGVQIGATTEDTHSGLQIWVAIANLNTVALLDSSSGTEVWWFNPDPDGVLSLGFELSPGVFTAPEKVEGYSPVFMGEFVYAVGGNNGLASLITRHNADGAIPTNYVDSAVLDGVYSSSTISLGTSDTGDLYVCVVQVTGTKLWKFDFELNLIHFWDEPDTVGTRLDQTASACGHFHVYKNQICFDYRPSAGDKEIALVTIGAGFSLTDHTHTLVHTGGPVINLSGGLMIDSDGVFSLDPPPALVILGDIVADLLERAGLTAAQYDVSDLTQEVRGFVVASQMTVHNAINILRKGWFFDVTEYDGKIVCRNRGHGATETIPDGDLCAHVPGTEPPEPLEVTRVPEQELPRTIYINYYDADNDYQQGSQYWKRTVTLSQSDVTLDLPIVFTASEAMDRAQWHMHFAWLERDRFTFYVTDAWCRLRPTDVVVVRGVNIRITGVTEMPTGIIKCEGVRAFAGAFTGSTITEPITGTPPGAPGEGQPPQTPPSGRADTGMVLIDGPLISEADGDYSFRAALYKDGTGSWPGAALYRSLDGGTTYAAVTSLSSATVVGTVATALGNWTGGVVVDEANFITVALTSSTASLSSTTEAGFLNGLNLIALGTASAGWEFLQFRTATLVTGNTWRLSGLLRGRFGTEHKMSTHGANETLIEIDGTVVVPGPLSDIGVSRKYKGATFGTALADAVAVDFTNTGVAAKAFAPVLLGGGRASGDLTINWIPRRRGSGGWLDGVDLPDTEPPEAYRVQIYTTSGYTTVARTITVSAATTTIYTSAQQTTDFGSPQATIYFDVAKLGFTGYGYAARGVL